MTRPPSPTGRPHADGVCPPAPTILVAEDDTDIRLMLKALLELKGYRVLLADDGQLAVETARAERPDLILVDLQLPRLNGFAVTRFVRQSDELRTVPVVIVTGHDPLKHRGLALAAGCNAYLQKPIDFDQLDELLLSLLPPIN
jgi:chemosensory pili system protein ChpA (sensor histidine kinase/response regulator)